MTHLTPEELSKRWKKSAGTLRNWRWKDIGPKYLKIGSRVRYLLQDIKQYEKENKHVTERPTYKLGGSNYKNQNNVGHR